MQFNFKTLNNLYPHPLMNEDGSGLTEDYFKVVVEIFHKYAKDDKLNINDFKLFYNNWLNAAESDTSHESESISLFHNLTCQKRDIGGLMNLFFFMRI